MSIGKYSPTVSAAYHADQDWWKRNGGEDPANQDKPSHVFFFDRGGYDSYGYNKDEIDRAGNTEMDYLNDVTYDDDGIPKCPLYDNADLDWGVDKNGFPARR